MLPQGIANSPTLCQKYVAQDLRVTRKQYPTVYLVHYIDDILLAHTNEGHLLTAFSWMQEGLKKTGPNNSP